MESLMESKVTRRFDERVDQGATRYVKKYRDKVQWLESSSLLSKVKTISAYDVYGLGKQLDNTTQFFKFCEDEGTLSQLGIIPRVAFDVITVAYGTAPIAAMASVQPIDEELGTVYFKQVIAQTTRGNITAGQNIASADAAPGAFPQGYAGDQLTQVGMVTVNAQTHYAFNLTGVPVRPFKTSVSVLTQVGTVTLRDIDGNGELVGYYGHGTISYPDGAMTIDLNTAPTNAPQNINVTYATDFASQTEIPKIIFKLTSRSVQARVFALMDTIGLESSYAMRRRFGLIAEDEIANDLVSAINGEITNTIVSLLAANVQDNVNFSRTPPTGVGFFEHKQTFVDALAIVESNILHQAGRGTISTIVCGRDVAAIIGTLPNFVKLSDGSTIGSHIYGTYNGAVVVRVPYQDVLGSEVAICMFKGTSPFEAPAVYAPYMPLVVTTALPHGTNPLLNMKAAAVWSGVEILVPKFISQLTVTA